MNELERELSGIKKLSALKNFLTDLEACDIKFWGGRKFGKKNFASQGLISINDIYKQIDRITRECHNEDQSIDDKSIFEIKDKLYELNIDSNKILENKISFTKICTYVRSFFGSRPSIEPFSLTAEASTRTDIIKKFAKDFIKDDAQKSKFILGVIFDETLARFELKEQDEEVKNLKDCLLKFCENQSDNKDDVIKAVDQFVNRHYDMLKEISIFNHSIFDRLVLTSLEYDMFFFYHLVIGCSNGGDKRLKETLAPILIAAYAKAKSFPQDFGCRNNPFYYHYLSQDVCEKAEKEYIEIRDKDDSYVPQERYRNASNERRIAKYEKSSQYSSLIEKEIKRVFLQLEKFGDLETQVNNYLTYKNEDSLNLDGLDSIRLLSLIEKLRESDYESVRSELAPMLLRKIIKAKPKIKEHDTFKRLKLDGDLIRRAEARPGS